MEFSVFQFVPTACCPATRHHWSLAPPSLLPPSNAGK